MVINLGLVVASSARDTNNGDGKLWCRAVVSLQTLLFQIMCLDLKGDHKSWRCRKQLPQFNPPVDLRKGNVSWPT